MPDDYAIIDLFAGPGGLGEGFSRAGRDATAPMHIRMSVEMDDHAIQTLRLRSFLRSFEAFPAEYYTALNTGAPLPDWSELYPRQWALAKEEVRQRVLGKPGVFEDLSRTLDDARDTSHGNTILIGGPPCQAYSLAGRSRNKGKDGYVLEEDGRHYLYREYVRILDRLNPAAFVMENVKGMLSSRVDGGGIFNRVLDDLQGAGDGYVLMPIGRCSPAGGGRPPAKNFLIRAEEHGVPQARHRVIVLGIRRDKAAHLSLSGPILAAANEMATVGQAIAGLSSLRSGLSRSDTNGAWSAAVRDQARAIADSPLIADRIREVAKSVAASNALPEARSERCRFKGTGLPLELDRWILDEKLGASVHHDTRGHIKEDLGRYLFSAAFTLCFGTSPTLSQYPEFLQPRHRNRASGDFADRFRTQAANRPSTTVTSHISKDGHYFIHPDPTQCRSLTVREAARLQTFPDNYYFCGPRTKQYHQVGNAVPPYLAWQIGRAVRRLLG